MPWKERKNVKFVRKFGLMSKNPFLLKVLTLRIFQFYGYSIGAVRPGECQPSATLITSTTPTTSITPTSPTTQTTPITSRETNQIPTTTITTTGLWKLGDKGESCDEVCSKIGKKCDLEALHAIKDRQKATKVFEATGVPCYHFILSKSDKAPCFQFVQNTHYCYFDGDGKYSKCDSKDIGYTRICFCKD